MKLDMSGKTALVMAASQGLGRGVAEALAAAGATLAICSRDDARIRAVGAEIAAAHGVEVLAQAADVGSESDLQAFVDAAGQRFGAIDVLVTNAGGPPAGRFVDLTDEQWSAAVAGNLLSVARAVRATLPYMRGRPGANIQCIVSSSVKAPIPQLVLSNALRPGIVGLAKTLSMELATDGIRVNCLAPGRIDTERVRHLDSVHGAAQGKSADEMRAASEATIPLGRYGHVPEFADVALWLASDGARYVTGQTIFVDGGLVKSLM
jgi:3-oxoacyl-[acyl-carrier protein] reductase